MKKTGAAILGGAVLTAGMGVGLATPAFASKKVQPWPASITRVLAKSLEKDGIKAKGANCVANLASRTMPLAVVVSDNKPAITQWGKTHEGALKRCVGKQWNQIGGLGTPTATTPPAPTTAAAPAPTTTTTAPPQPTTGSVGQTLYASNDSGSTAAVTLDQIVDPFTGGDGFQTADAGTRWVAVEVTLSASVGTVQSDANNDFTVVGSDGQVYQSNIGADVELDNASMTNFNSGNYEVTANTPENGWVGFQIPTGVSVAKVSYNTTDGFGGTTATWTVAS